MCFSQSSLQNHQEKQPRRLMSKWRIYLMITSLLSHRYESYLCVLNTNLYILVKLVIVNNTYEQDTLIIRLWRAEVQRCIIIIKTVDKHCLIFKITEETSYFAKCVFPRQPWGQEKEKRKHVGVIAEVLQIHGESCVEKFRTKCSYSANNCPQHRKLQHFQTRPHQAFTSVISLFVCLFLLQCGSDVSRPQPHCSTASCSVPIERLCFCVL